MRKFVECFDDACECVDCVRERQLIDSEVCMKRQEQGEEKKEKGHVD